MCLFGLLCSLVQAQSLDEAGTKALVEKIAAKRQAKPFIQADYREEKSGGILSRPAISTGKLWYSAPNKFRKESKGAGRESIIVSNGNLLWMFYPAFQEAERYDLKKQKFLNQGIAAFTTGLDFAQVERDFTVSAEESGDGFTLRLTPKKSAISRMLTQLTVRFSKNLELQFVETSSPRGEKILTNLSNLSAAQIPDTLFEFMPPPGATISTPLGK